jgi:hypothetical protein
LITGASSAISAQFLNPAQSSATKADGLIFDGVLSVLIRGNESATSMQEEPTVSPETKDPEERADQEATEQGYLNLYPYRILQDGKATVSIRNVLIDGKVDETEAWLVNVAEKQQVITAKLDNAVPTVQTPARPEEFEAKAHSEHLPLSDAAITTNASGSQANDQTFTPESIGIREHGEKEHYLTNGDLQRQQGDFSSAESENLFEQGSANRLPCW